MARTKLHTADLLDRHPDRAWVVEPRFRSYGHRDHFHGPIETVRTFEDDLPLRELLGSPGDGRVLVVDGGASLRCALLDAPLAKQAAENGWAGLLISGAVRHVTALARVELGVAALGSSPRAPLLRAAGQASVSVRFGGVTFEPGHWLYADPDGVITSWQPLHG